MGKGNHNYRRHQLEKRQPRRSRCETQDLLRLRWYLERRPHTASRRPSEQSQASARPVWFPRDIHRSPLTDSPSGFGTNRFLETVRKMKRSAPVPQVCPSCGSGRIRVQDSLSGWLLPPLYSCEKCGYVGRLILELEPADLDKKER
jgi:predicted RNA-binding Zn-ribbon protein involved in translation (DUF1610 family)